MGVPANYTNALGKELPQNPGGSFLCPPRPPPGKNAPQNAYRCLPPSVRLPRIRGLQFCADRYATPGRESEPVLPFSARLQAPSALSDRLGAGPVGRDAAPNLAPGT